MFSRSEARRCPVPGAGPQVLPLHTPAVDPVTLLTALSAVAAAAAALLIPQPAEAGRVDVPPLAARPPERAAAAADDDGTYQLRCWQYGRLLFEERALQLATDSVEGLKLSGTDRRRQPVMVTDTGNATCLIRRGGTERRH
jgi:hypothetical protein